LGWGRKPESYFFTRILKNGDKVVAAPDKKLRIVLGGMDHITGTDTYLEIIDESGQTVLLTVLKVLGAVATGGFGINDKITTNVTNSIETAHLWLPRGFAYRFGGAATARIYLLLEEKDQ